ncbi:DUF1707 SHOCT-like domain-containing protein [Yinghuangia soli]|uniref:DUF1707 domain-containing protein n=1 Tax=Yinghuangia soli TaxID=2908204 RepID=A0AA41U0T6_9ACTN|nr:DUF1707 domain-containing protein [Yinghuangia soli]MCF2530128.1 DUF1707 domain-containing protein [Yinghuangia soli]
MDSDATRPAGAADRARVTDALREEMAAGRLPLADYQARLGRVKRAATVGELDAVLHDLPSRRDRADDDAERPGGGAAGPPGESGTAAGRVPKATRGGCAGVLLLTVAAAYAVRSAARFPISRVRALD